MAAKDRRERKIRECGGVNASLNGWVNLDGYADPKSLSLRSLGSLEANWHPRIWAPLSPSPNRPRPGHSKKRSHPRTNPIFQAKYQHVQNDKECRLPNNSSIHPTNTKPLTHRPPSPTLEPPDQEKYRRS